MYVIIDSNNNNNNFNHGFFPLTMPFVENCTISCSRKTFPKFCIANGGVGRLTKTET